MATKIKAEADYARMGDPALLDKIDILFEFNLGYLVDIPQLVVVGDQSSGKSSVLAGLTKLPFPRDSGLCTRFATQIIFRRSNVKTIKVSINPGPKSDAAHVEKVKNWYTEFERLDADTFKRILSEVNDMMNISSQETKGCPGFSTFSEDVLRLEIQGPDEDHLSVIDVPGLFTNTTEGVTSKEDIQIVREIVLGYMRNPRSVMLAVVPANVDIATQTILEYAKEVDPNGERTLGVFTKPDLIDKGAEAPVLDLLRGKRSRVKLGWNIVRNPGQQDLNEGKTDRHSEERFFKEVSPWNTVEKDKTGIAALRTRLQQIFNNHIRREFPKVKAEIHKKLKDCKSALESLGAERVTREQQAAFILEVAMAFQNIANQALETNYGHEMFDQHPNTRLATVLVGREEKFAETMDKWGHEQNFNDEDEVATEYTLQLDALGNALDCHSGSQSAEGYNGELEPLRTIPNPPELEDALSEHGTVKEPGHIVLEWIEEVYRTSKGFEIGTFNSALLSTLMKRQSMRWEAISLGYISDAIAIVHQFISTALKHICADERVHDSLLDHLMDELTEKYKSTLKHVHFLLAVEMTGNLRTEDPSFNADLNERRQKGNGTQSVDHPMSNSESRVRDIHDILKCYYEIARRRFTDAVINQAAHYHLLTGPATPLRLLSPGYVQRMTDETLESIAGEDPDLKRKRELLNQEINELKTARRILR